MSCEAVDPGTKKSSPDLRSELDPYGIPIEDRYMYVPAFALCKVVDPDTKKGRART